jgi:integrase
MAGKGGRKKYDAATLSEWGKRGVTQEEDDAPEEARDTRAKTKSQRSIKKVRGVFEKDPDPSEDNERVQFLNQFIPSKTELEDLKPRADEESSLRTVILKHYAAHMPEFEIALHTGMRPSEQYGLEWPRGDLARNFVSLPKTKTGKARHIRLNVVAVAAFKVLQQRSLNREPGFC